MWYTYQAPGDDPLKTVLPLFIIILLACLLGCSATPTVEHVEVPVEITVEITVEVPVEVPVTVIRTREPLSTYTPYPTHTRYPTFTPLPALSTSTPYPTQTPQPPLPTYTPYPTMIPADTPAPQSVPSATPSPIPFVLPAGWNKVEGIVNLFWIGHPPEWEISDLDIGSVSFDAPNLAWASFAIGRADCGVTSEAPYDDATMSCLTERALSNYYSEQTEVANRGIYDDGSQEWFYVEIVSFNEEYFAWVYDIHAFRPASLPES